MLIFNYKIFHSHRDKPLFYFICTVCHKTTKTRTNRGKSSDIHPLTEIGKRKKNISDTHTHIYRFNGTGFFFSHKLFTKYKRKQNKRKKKNNKIVKR
jgi:hypothetical protein